jgi:hypothetical protein
MFDVCNGIGWPVAGRAGRTGLRASGGGAAVIGATGLAGGGGGATRLAGDGGGPAGLAGGGGGPAGLAGGGGWPAFPFDTERGGTVGGEAARCAEMRISRLPPKEELEEEVEEEVKDLEARAEYFGLGLWGKAGAPDPRPAVSRTEAGFCIGRDTCFCLVCNCCCWWCCSFSDHMELGAVAVRAGAWRCISDVIVSEIWTVRVGNSGRDWCRGREALSFFLDFFKSSFGGSIGTLSTATFCLLLFLFITISSILPVVSSIRKPGRTFSESSFLSFDSVLRFAFSPTSLFFFLPLNKKDLRVESLLDRIKENGGVAEEEPVGVAGAEAEVGETDSRGLGEEGAETEGRPRLIEKTDFHVDGTLYI